MFQKNNTTEQSCAHIHALYYWLPYNVKLKFEVNYKIETEGQNYGKPNQGTQNLEVQEQDA